MPTTPEGRKTEGAGLPPIRDSVTAAAKDLRRAFLEQLNVAITQFLAGSKGPIETLRFYERVKDLVEAGYPATEALQALMLRPQPEQAALCCKPRPGDIKWACLLYTSPSPRD